MKRRKFLTTVGGAAGVATLGGCCTTTKPTGNGSNPGNKQRPTSTYALSPITDPKPPFTLPVRQPGWFPDGADIGGHRKRLFLEEVCDITPGNVTVPFGVEFDYTGTSKKWILGSRLDTTHANDFTKFLQRLAVKIRQYNASLYRLRRLHFYWDYREKDDHLVKYPKANPHGDPKTTPNPNGDLPGFNKMVMDAEADWVKVTDQVDALLERALSDNNNLGIKLLAVDTVAANGYIVSLRVVANDIRPVAQGQGAEGAPPPEVGGSDTSHVSISSVFSSSSQN